VANAVIAGVGEATLTPQGSGRAADRMAVEAALAACRDAGVDPAQVDGIVKYTYDGAISTMMLGATLGAREVRAFIEIPSGGGSSVALVDVARALVLAGRARAVLCLRTLLGAEWLRQMTTGDPLRPYYLDGVNYLRPAGWTGYLHMFAALYEEYAARYPSMSREVLFASANLMRQNAARNPESIFKDPIPREQYFDEAARTVGPFTRYDEYASSDLSCAVLVTAEGFTDSPAREVLIVASAQSHGPDPKTWFDLRPTSASYPESPSSWAARAIYDEAGIGPGQISVATLYDCTSFTYLDLVEAFGLCGPGEVAELVKDGALLSDGAMPVNPHGGDLTCGYSAGFRHVLEATRQLRGEARNQTRDPEYALVSAPQIGPTSAAILKRPERG
jgi:acetyl-CoA acetyltransferase